MNRKFAKKEKFKLKRKKFGKNQKNGTKVF